MIHTDTLPHFVDAKEKLSAVRLIAVRLIEASHDDKAWRAATSIIAITDDHKSIAQALHELEDL